MSKQIQREWGLQHCSDNWLKQELPMNVKTGENMQRMLFTFELFPVRYLLEDKKGK